MNSSSTTVTQPLAGVGVAVGTGVGVRVGVGVGVAVGVGVGDAVGIAEGLAVGLDVGVEDGVGLAVEVGLGLRLAETTVKVVDAETDPWSLRLVVAVLAVTAWVPGAVGGTTNDAANVPAELTCADGMPEALPSQLSWTFVLAGKPAPEIDAVIPSVPVDGERVRVGPLARTTLAGITAPAPRSVLVAIASRARTLPRRRRSVGIGR